MILFRVYNRLKEKNISAQDTRFVLVTESTKENFLFKNTFNYYKSGSGVHFKGAAIDFNPFNDSGGIEQSQITDFFSKEFYMHKFYFRGGGICFFLVSLSILTEEEILLLQEALLDASSNNFDIFDECSKCRVFHNGEIDFDAFSNTKEKQFVYKQKQIKNFDKDIKELYDSLRYYEEKIKDCKDKRKLIYDTLTDEEKLMIEVDDGG